MPALSAADERRALMRAAERFELCRLFGKGNARSGLYILTEMEHRAALAVMPPAKPEAEPEPEEHLVVLSVRRSRIRDGGEWAEVAVQAPRRASPRWRNRLADRGGVAPSASG